MSTLLCYPRQWTRLFWVLPIIMASLPFSKTGQLCLALVALRFSSVLLWSLNVESHLRYYKGTARRAHFQVIYRQRRKRIVCFFSLPGSKTDWDDKSLMNSAVNVRIGKKEERPLMWASVLYLGFGSELTIQSQLGRGCTQSLMYSASGVTKGLDGIMWKPRMHPRSTKKVLERFICIVSVLESTIPRKVPLWAGEAGQGQRLETRRIGRWINALIEMTSILVPCINVFERDDFFIYQFCCFGVSVGK